MDGILRFKNPTDVMKLKMPTFLVWVPFGGSFGFAGWIVLVLYNMEIYEKS